MSAADREPVRWTERSPEQRSDAAAALIRTMGEPVLPDGAALARVRARLTGSTRATGWKGLLRWLPVFGVLGAGVALAAVSGGGFFARAGAPRVQPGPVTKPRVQRLPAAPEATRSLALVSNDRPTMTTPSLTTAARKQGTQEASALAAAIRALRQKKDARAGLAALDAYDARFPSGALKNEARLVRVEALMAAGDRTGALRVLENLTFTGAPRRREMSLLRGELRAEADRCPAALADLGAVLSAVPHDPLDERSLAAIVSCANRLGDSERAHRAAVQLQVLKGLPRPSGPPDVFP
jgi:hypothetical protein